MTRAVCTIVGIDPGEHTGIAITTLVLVPSDSKLRYSNHPILPNCLMTVSHIETADNGMDRIARSLKNHVMPVMGAASHTHPVVVACENFIFTRTSQIGQAKGAVKVMGMLEYIVYAELAHRENILLDQTQKPSEAGLITRDVLSALGLHRRGDKNSDHAQMALKHAVLAATRVRRGAIKL